MIGWRAAIAGVVLLGALAVRAPGRLRVPAREIPFFALFGLVVAGNYACYFLALQRVPVAVAIILLYTYPAFTALAARVLFNEPLTGRKILAVALTFAGIVLIAVGGNAPSMRVSPAGLLLGLGSGLTMAAYGLMGKRATRRFSPWTTACYSFAAAAVWLTLVRSQEMAGALAYAPAMWAGLLYLAVGPTLLAYGLFLWAVQRVDVSRVSVWTTLEPPISSLLALVVLGEAISPSQGLGGLVILAGVMTMTTAP